MSSELYRDYSHEILQRPLPKLDLPEHIFSENESETIPLEERKPLTSSRYSIVQHHRQSSYNTDRTIGENPGMCAFVLTIISFVVIALTLPFSLFLCIKVVQEYERAVIFRLGRLTKGGAKGPGIFFIIPCIDSYRKVDLRTVSFDVPPQE
ncbi:mechanosensory protein 2-like protein 1, partial [Sarcoptes scabiei]